MDFASLGSTITLVTRRRAGDARVELGATELQRLLLNLVVNAKEAMPEGGAVGLETRLVHRVGKSWVHLSVSDTGPGVAPDSLPGLLETGVSSKRPGGGLGLSIVKDLVTSAGGMIDLSSEPDCGATFSVLLPVVW